MSNDESDDRETRIDREYIPIFPNKENEQKLQTARGAPPSRSQKTRRQKPNRREQKKEDG